MISWAFLFSPLTHLAPPPVKSTWRLMSLARRVVSPCLMECHQRMEQAFFPLWPVGLTAECGEEVVNDKC